MPAVFFYISGHGFGHSSRQIEIINALGAARDARGRPRHPQRGALEIVVRTSAPRWLFDRTVRAPFDFIDGEVDTGVAQLDSLRLDERETIRRAAAFHRELASKAAAERERLRARDARLVVSDAPALGCAAASAAGIPSAVCSNFTWDWIYAGYRRHLAEAPDLVPIIAAAYRHAGAAWRLPMHGGFATFERIDDVPFVARHASRDRAQVRNALGLPDDSRLVLSSFSRYGVDGLDLRSLDCLDRYQIVVTETDGGALPAGVHVVNAQHLYDSGLRYEDLVGAVDVVATKPGYGIIAECIANDTAVLYTSRGRFVEYDVLVREMPRFLRCGFIDNASLLAGHWGEALDRILALPPAPERPATNGADVVAEKIVRLAGLKPRAPYRTSI